MLGRQLGQCREHVRARARDVVLALKPPIAVGIGGLGDAPITLASTSGQCLALPYRASGALEGAPQPRDLRSGRSRRWPSGWHSVTSGVKPKADLCTAPVWSQSREALTRTSRGAGGARGRHRYRVADPDIASE